MGASKLDSLGLPSPPTLAKSLRPLHFTRDRGQGATSGPHAQRGEKEEQEEEEEDRAADHREARGWAGNPPRLSPSLGQEENCWLAVLRLGAIREEP